MNRMNAHRFFVVRMISLMALLSATLSAPTMAQTTGAGVPLEDTWYIVPGIAQILPDSMFGAGQHGQAYGLALGKPVSKSWDMQLLTKFGRSENDNLTYKQNILGIDALYMFNREPFHPFLLFGAGYQRDRLSGNATTISDRSPYINAGIGVQIALDRRWNVQLDFRRELGFLKNSDFASDHNRNNYVSLNLSYSFN